MLNNSIHKLEKKLVSNSSLDFDSYSYVILTDSHIALYLSLSHSLILNATIFIIIILYFCKINKV